VLIFGVKQARKNLSVIDIGGCNGISTDKTMVDINADAVLVSVIVDANFFTSGRQNPSTACDLAFDPSHLIGALL